MALHMLKLSAGTEDMDSLAAWQDGRSAERRRQGLDPRPRHVTRMWPRRAEEIVAGGSLYWVIKGIVRCRQRIAALEEVTGDDGIRRCAIVMEPGLIPVEARPRRPFQGWRYLEPEDAPPDLDPARADEAHLPNALAEALDGLGVIARAS